MKDEGKTKEQLVNELVELRQRVAELEASETTRKRAEEALRESEENFRTLAEGANDGILIAVGKGIHAYANKRAAEITGYSVAELLKISIKGLAHPDEFKKIMERYRKRLEGKPVPRQYETIITRKDGKSVPIELTGAKTTWHGQPADIVMIRDITERKRAGEALRESEEGYRTIFGTTGTATVILEEDRTISLANTEFERLSGYSREEIEGKKSWTEFVVKDDLERMKEYHRRRRIGPNAAPRNYEFRFIDRIGNVKDIFLTIAVIPGTKKSVASLLDITERKRAEERIEHLNLVLRAIRTVNQLVVREKDRDTLLKGACNSLIETRGYYNAWIVILDESGGLVTTAEAGWGKDSLPIVERLKRGELIDCGRRALVQSDVVAIEDPPSTCPDCPLAEKCLVGGAMTVRLEHGGKVYGLLSVSIPAHLAADEEEQTLFKEVARDIAFALHDIELEKERKRAEEALRESDRRFRDVAENALEWIWEVDANGKYTYASPVVEKILGYKPEEVLKKHFYDLFHPEDREELKKAAFEVFGKKQSFHEFTNRNVNKNGKTVWLSTSGVPTLDEKGNLLGYRGADIDITERKRAEEALKEYSEHLEEMVEERTKELREAQEELVRKEKLAVLGQLAGGVGHELRNPLGVISNAIYYLQTTLLDADETTKEYLEIIRSEVHNSGKIVSDLLDFSRARPAEREAIAVSDLVAQVLEKQPPPEEVKVTTKIAPDLPPLFVDPRQIEQVLVNLVTNAYQAMPEGGRLTVKAKGEKGQAYISVSDTGCGISKENMKMLFEPLFTTKARGIGLGLAISKNLVEVNGGSIEVESPSPPLRTGQEGKGSTFTVILPTKEAQT